MPLGAVVGLVEDFLSPQLRAPARDETGCIDPADAGHRVGGLIRVIAARDPAQLSRSGVTARLAADIAVELKWGPWEVFLLQEAALLQDVGTLYSPGDGTAADPDRAHPLMSAMMTEGILLARQVEWIRSHHERWDGTGYPAGLHGDEIPIGAAMIGMADTWQGLTDAGARARDEALPVCEAMAGRSFAEPVVAGLIRSVTSSRAPP